MSFAPDYLRLVLSENFEDAKALFLEPLMAIHYAHLAMLAEQGIVTSDDARAIRQALDAIDRDALERTGYDGSCEDLFFYVNRLAGRGLRAGRRRPAAYRAQPQRHRHDDVPDAAARVDSDARRGRGRAADRR